MKLFISADIEGTCGICDWQETNIGNHYSDYFLNQMSKEVAAVCRAAQNCGFNEIVVKDAHDTARNIFPNLLPKGVHIIRGWSEDPLVMMSGLDKSFDAVAYTGYHSRAGNGDNPLSHTMSTKMQLVKINGVAVSEFNINSIIASYYEVPSVLLTGDKALCESAKQIFHNIGTVGVNEGFGGAAKSMQPEDAIELIEKTANEIFSGDFIKDSVLPMPDSFMAELTYKNHPTAYLNSFYPGAKLTSDPRTIAFETKDYYELLRFFLFVL